MAESYNKWYITQMQMNAQQAATNASKQINFKRIIASSDIYKQSDLQTLTNSAIGTIKVNQNALVGMIKIDQNTITVAANFTNSGLKDAYKMNTLFLIAEYNGSEYLAAATTAVNPWYMSEEKPDERVEYTFKVKIVISNTAIVNTTIDPNVEVLHEEFDDYKKHQDERDSGQDGKITILENADKNNVKITGNQSVDGTKTFLQKIIGSISGTAGTAIKLLTGRTIRTNLSSNDYVTFDGTSNVTPGVSGILPVANGGTGNGTGNAPSATKLNPGRNVQVNLASQSATKFDGTVDVKPGVTGVLPIANGGTGRNDGLADPLGHSIGANTDLNSLIKVGFYHASQNAVVATFKNSPIKYAFSLIVERNGADDDGTPAKAGYGTKQTLSAYNSSDTYTRYNTGGVWSRWVKVLIDFPRAMSGNFSDIKAIVTDIPKWSGRWSASNMVIANKPTGFGNYWVLEVIPGYNAQNGVLVAHDYQLGKHSLATVNNGILSPWRIVGDDANAVHKTGNETASGDKTFNGVVTINNTLNGHQIELSGRDNPFIDFHALSTTEDYISRIMDSGGGLYAYPSTPAGMYISLVYHEATDANPLNIDTMVGGMPKLSNLNMKSVTRISGGTKSVTGNLPTGYNGLWSILEHVPQSGSDGYQRLTSVSTGIVYIRTRTANKWQAWHPIAKDDLVVHKTGGENIAGVKRFTDNLHMINSKSIYFDALEADKLNVLMYATHPTYGGQPILRYMHYDKAGSMVGISASGTTMIGGGESVLNFMNILNTGGAKPAALGNITPSSKQLLLASDGSVVIHSGYNAGGTTGATWQFDAAGNLQQWYSGKWVSRISSNGNMLGNLDGNASSATKLATARTIGGVSFNGTANINLPGVNVAGNQSTTGNAATATKAVSADELTTARKINGVAFNGTSDISITDPNAVHKNAALSMKEYSVNFFGATNALQFHVTDTGVGVTVAGTLHMAPSNGGEKAGVQIPAGVPLPPYDIRIPWTSWAGIGGVTLRSGFHGFFLLKKDSRDIYYKQLSLRENDDKDYTISAGVDTSGFYPTH